MHHGTHWAVGPASPLSLGTCSSGTGADRAGRNDALAAGGEAVTFLYPVSLKPTVIHDAVWLLFGSQRDDRCLVCLHGHKSQSQCEGGGPKKEALISGLRLFLLLRRWSIVMELSVG